MSPGCALLRSLWRSRSLWRWLCCPRSPKQPRLGETDEVDGAAGGAAGTPYPSCRDTSPALRRSTTTSGHRGAVDRGAAPWQSYRLPSLTPRSTFAVDSDEGGGQHRSMSMSQLQHSRHGLGHGVLERVSGEESVAGGSPLVQVMTVM